MPAQKLPTEIILAIVEALVPKGSMVILSPSDPTTKTILACTTVCSATYPPASDLLWRHCLYIDSAHKASQILGCLKTPHPNLRRFLSGNPQIGMYMSLFPLDYDEEGRALLQQLLLEIDADAPDDSDFEIEVQAEVTGGGTPIPNPSPLNDPSTAMLVEETFRLLSPILTKLVINMPLRTLYPEDDSQGIRPILRCAFEHLVHLEEFVSVRDELYLSTRPNSFRSEPEVWSTCWPKLRRIALYNPIIDSQDKTWRDMVDVPNLEMAIFTRADPGGVLDEINMKAEWSHAILQRMVQRRRPGDVPDMTPIPMPIRPMTLGLVDCNTWIPKFSQYAEHWQHLDPENVFRVVTKVPNLPAPLDDRDYDDDVNNDDGVDNDGDVEIDDVDENEYENDESDPIKVCQNWIEETALSGTLWEEVASGFDCCRQWAM